MQINSVQMCPRQRAGEAHSFRKTFIVLLPHIRTTTITYVWFHFIGHVDSFSLVKRFPFCIGIKLFGPFFWHLTIYVTSDLCNNSTYLSFVPDEK